MTEKQELSAWIVGASILMGTVLTMVYLFLK